MLIDDVAPALARHGLRLDGGFGPDAVDRRTGTAADGVGVCGI